MAVKSSYSTRLNLFELERLAERKIKGYGSEAYCDVKKVSEVEYKVYVTLNHGRKTLPFMFVKLSRIGGFTKQFCLVEEYELNF